MRLSAAHALTAFDIMPKQLAIVASGNDRASVWQQHAAARERQMSFLERLCLTAVGVHVVERSVHARRKRALAIGRDGETQNAGGQLVIVREGEFHEFTRADRGWVRPVPPRDG